MIFPQFKRSIIISLCVFASPVSASEDFEVVNPLFFGAKVGYQLGNDASYNKTPSETLFGGYVGYQFRSDTRWDLGYQSHTELDGEGGIKVKTSLIESAVGYDFYSHGDFSAYGRVGGGYWDVNKVDSLGSSLSGKGFSPLVEVGVSYKLSKHIELIGGYQYINKIGSSDTRYYDSHALTIGARFKFSQEITPLPTIQEITPLPTIQEITPLPTIQEITPPLTITNDTAPIIFDVSSILFEHDSFWVDKSEIKKTYKVLIRTLKENPLSKVDIIGHSDATGSALYNQELSEKRAIFVAQVLEGAGVRKEQINIIGMGEADSTSTNKPARRVDFNLNFNKRT